MPISVVFDPPLPSDSPSTFNTKAFTLLGDLNDWSTQANALPGEVATNLTTLLASPPAIGSTTPAAVSATTLSASGNISLTSAANADLTLTRAAYSNYSMISFNTVAGQSWGVGSRTSGVTPSDSFSIYSSTYGGNALSITNSGAVTIPGTLGVSGATTLSGNLQASGVVAVIRGGSSSGASLTYMQSALGASSYLDFQWGKAGASYQCGVLKYYADATTPTSASYVDIGLFGGSSGLMVNGAGAVTIPGTLSLTGGTFGYGTGAGGTVTQATNKSTAVTLNKPSGQITMHNAALAAGATVFFYLANTTIVNGDLIVVTPYWANGDYQVWAATVYGGTALIAVKNITAGSLSDAFVLRFAVIKGAAS